MNISFVKTYIHIFGLMFLIIFMENLIFKINKFENENFNRYDIFIADFSIYST